MTAPREAKGFDRRLFKLVDEDARADIETTLAEQPTAGDLVAGSGGARKLRWTRPGKGRRGGVRVIYYFHDGKGMIWFLAVYAKNDKENLTTAELNELKNLVKDLKET